MRKRNHILFFLSLLLTGYCCQIGRFFTAFQQYTVSHTYEKGLTKRVIALRLDSRNSLAEKKLLFKKNFKSSNPIFTEGNYSSALNTRSTPLHAGYSQPAYFPPILFSSGERGPPALI